MTNGWSFYIRPLQQAGMTHAFSSCACESSPKMGGKQYPVQDWALPALMLHHCCRESKQKTGRDLSIYSCYNCRLFAYTELKLEYIPYLFNDSFLPLPIQWLFPPCLWSWKGDCCPRKSSPGKEASSESWHEEHNTPGNWFGHADQTHQNAFWFQKERRTIVENYA